MQRILLVSSKRAAFSHLLYNNPPFVDPDALSIWQLKIMSNLQSHGIQFDMVFWQTATHMSIDPGNISRTAKSVGNCMRANISKTDTGIGPPIKMSGHDITYKPVR